MAYHPLRTSIRLAERVIDVHRCAPAPDLAQRLIEFYEYCVHDDVPHAPVQVYPSGVAVLRFDLRADGVDATLFGPSLSPHMRGWFYRGVPVFGVAIQAARAYQLLGLAVSELTDLRVALDVFWPFTIRVLKEQLWAARGFAQRVAITSAFLRTVLRPRAPQPEFLRAFESLVTTHGAVNVQRACGRESSMRTLRRQFTQYVGLSPKQTARVIRFQQVLTRLVRGVDVNYARLAQLTGYSDQAHMIREFVELVGVTPGRYVASLSQPRSAEQAPWTRADPHGAMRPAALVWRVDRPLVMR